MQNSILTNAVRALAATAPTLRTSQGELRGGVCQGSNQNVNYFHSIPYAQAPIGDLRFAAPKAYDAQYTNGSRDAAKGAPACVSFSKTGDTHGETSEDCLYLSIWKPANADNKAALPVRVFVQGGGHASGDNTASMSDGCSVAHDSVMVSLNYRLGPLGFLALDNNDIDGNQGIHDIKMGLEWVQSNIEAFGGNPEQVLLHGQSNGASDAYAVATLNEAPKLMNAFIHQSGGMRDLASKYDTVAESKNFAQALQCDANDIKCFREKPTADITKAADNSKTSNAAALKVATESGGRFNFGAHVDGKLFSKQPYEQAVQVPSIFGINKDEGTIFTQAYATGQQGLAGTTEQDYQRYLQEHFGDNAKKIEERYPISAFQNTPFPSYYAISQVITDSAFVCPANRALKAASDKNVPVWAYNFAHTPHCAWDQTNMPEKDRQYMGAAHGAELPFVFGMTSQLPRPNGTCKMTDEEQKITAYMRQAFTEFAAKRVQSHGDKTWEQWSPANPQGLTIDKGVNPGPVNFTACQFWDEMKADQDKNRSSPSSASSNDTGVHPPSPTAPPNLQATGAASSLQASAKMAGVTALCLGVLFMTM